MPSVLLYGDTVRYPALRHEIPLEIMDALMLVDTGEQTFVLTSSLEAARIRAVLPEAELTLYDELGLFDLVREGMARGQAELQVVIRALRRWGIEDVVVPGRPAGRGRRPDPGRRRCRERRWRRRRSAPADQERRRARRHPPCAARRRGGDGRRGAADPRRRAPSTVSSTTTAGRSPPRPCEPRSASLRGRGMSGAAGHHGRVAALRRRSRPRLRAAAGGAADRASTCGPATRRAGAGRT